MTWILAHPIQTLVYYWLFSAVVSGMPDYTAASSVGYTWLNRSLHLLSGNVTTAIQSRYPALIPPPAPGTSSTTTVGIVSEQHTEIPNNGK